MPRWTPAARTALPQPPKTSQKVPKNSAAARFERGIVSPALSCGVDLSARRELLIGACEIDGAYCDLGMEHAAGVMGAPGEGGAAEEAVEETGVEGLEDFVEIVVVAGGCGEAFAAAGLADVLGLFGDGFRGDVAAVAVGVGAGYRLLVELGEEDVGDGVMDGLGCGLEEVR